jgi:hypothetical protein
VTIERFILSMTSVFMAACVGCGNEDWGKVSGTVTLDGQPVGPGMVTFEPTSPDQVDAPFAGAQFREDGKYELRSPGNKVGALTGEYAVRIQSYAGETFGDEVPLQGKPRNVKIPMKYIDPSKSGLTATVESGSQVIDFDLKP